MVSSLIFFTKHSTLLFFNFLAKLLEKLLSLVFCLFSLNFREANKSKYLFMCHSKDNFNWIQRRRQKNQMIFLCLNYEIVFHNGVKMLSVFALSFQRIFISQPSSKWPNRFLNVVRECLWIMSQVLSVSLKILIHFYL